VRSREIRSPLHAALNPNELTAVACADVKRRPQRATVNTDLMVQPITGRSMTVQILVYLNADTQGS
jgi:hypothetical protein